jgi:hypothetical protein
LSGLLEPLNACWRWSLLKAFCRKGVLMVISASPTVLAPSPALCAEGTASPKDPIVVGSIEFSAGVWDSAFGVKFEEGHGLLAEKSVSSTLGVVPAIEWGLGQTVFVGAELVLLWVDDPFWRLKQRRPLTGLNGRVRLSFPVYGGFTADVLVSTGPAAWSSDPRDGTFYGWSRRLGFGSSYQLNDDLQPYLHISYYDVNSYSVEGTFDPEPITSGQLLDVSAVLFSIGVRAGQAR